MNFDFQNIDIQNLELLKLLTENLPDMLWIKDINGTYIYANQSICDGLLMAKDVNEPIGKNDVFFALRERETHKENPNWHTFGELCFNSDVTVIENNKPMKFEEYGNVKGKLLYLEVNKAPIHDKDGNIIGTVGSGRDITELKNIQNKLATQAQILEQINDAIITTDLDSNIKSWNMSAHNIFGYKDLNMIDKNINILFHTKDQNLITENIERLNNKNSHNTTLNLFNENKQLVISDVTISKLKDEDGNTSRIIYCIRDITYKEKLNSEIKKQEKIISDNSPHAAMGAMIGNIAHQWRQPLATISTAITSIQVQKELDVLEDKSFFYACDVIHENSKYLSNTIDDFKNFIRGDRTLKVFNLHDDINSFLSLVDSNIKSNNIQLTLDIQKDIEIHGNENELIQCFMNIFNNSQDALLDIDKECRYVFITATKDENNINITIKDNAGGIPEDILENIFDPYFTTKEDGTGLGLNMTYQLIEEGMNGKLEASNVKFEHQEVEYTGAEFRITLPVS